MREIKRVSEAKKFVTKDGSSVREVVSPHNSPLKKQSLAEATVAPGRATKKHKHIKSDESYFILRGRGKLFFKGKVVEVRKGTAVAIPAGTPHRVENTGKMPLVFLCHCCPPYSHSDTVILT